MNILNIGRSRLTRFTSDNLVWVTQKRRKRTKQWSPKRRQKTSNKIRNLPLTPDWCCSLISYFTPPKFSKPIWKSEKLKLRFWFGSTVRTSDWEGRKNLEENKKVKMKKKKRRTLIIEVPFTFDQETRGTKETIPNPKIFQVTSTENIWETKRKNPFLRSVSTSDGSVEEEVLGGTRKKTPPPMIDTNLFPPTTRPKTYPF